VGAGQNKSRPYTILIVDDEESDRSTTRRVLEEAGYIVLESDSFQDGFGRFEAHRDSIDLVVADIALPDGNGCELALTMRNQNPDLRVLFISGHVGAEVCRYYGLDVSDLHFLRKPFGPEDLCSRVEAVLAAADTFPRGYKPKVRTSSADASSD
jgi:DNA-binding response OmpR family regulator